MIFGLIGLALIDSTSVGTLLVPLWYLSRAKARIMPLITYGIVLGGFYWAVGMLLLAGFNVVNAGTELLNSQVAYWTQLGLGIALLAWGVLSKTPDKDHSARKWQQRLNRELTNQKMAAIAIGAGVVELATMLPYLAAVGLIGRMQLTSLLTASVLAGYCIVMFVPALLFSLIRGLLGDRGTAFLEQAANWLAGQLSSTLLWGAAIFGLLLAADATRVLFG